MEPKTLEWWSAGAWDLDIVYKLEASGVKWQAPFFGFRHSSLVWISSSMCAFRGVTLQGAPSSAVVLSRRVGGRIVGHKKADCHADDHEREAGKKCIPHGIAENRDQARQELGWDLQACGWLQ